MASQTQLLLALCTLSLEGRFFMSAGSEKNLKLMTAEVIGIFKALLKTKKDEWMH